MAKTRELPAHIDGPQVNFDGPQEKPGELTARMMPAETPVPNRPTMDPALRLAAKMDRLLAEVPAGQREWALRWLLTKYPLPRQADPNI